MGSVLYFCPNAEQQITAVTKIERRIRFKAIFKCITKKTIKNLIISMIARLKCKNDIKLSCT
jgi:predicted type IV restriction endonuclease